MKVREEINIKYSNAETLLSTIKGLVDKGVDPKDIEVDYEAYEDYGSPSANIYLAFNREETDEERKAREKKTRDMRLLQEQREKAAYLELKKKFEQ